MSKDVITVPNPVLIRSASEMLKEGHSVILRPRGNSMLPFIHGQYDNVKLEILAEVKVGDIVLAEIDTDRFVLHRVFEKDGDDLTLMGDGNCSGVEHCTVDNVIGTVTEIIRHNGHSVDPHSRIEMRRARTWRRLRPLRRYILGLYRRLPWNKKEIKINSR